VKVLNLSEKVNYASCKDSSPQEANMRAQRANWEVEEYFETP